jgi:hypothetical protein
MTCRCDEIAAPKTEFKMQKQCALSSMLGEGREGKMAAAAEENRAFSAGVAVRIADTEYPRRVEL